MSWIVKKIDCDVKNRTIRFVDLIVSSQWRFRNNTN